MQNKAILAVLLILLLKSCLPSLGANETIDSHPQHESTISTQQSDDVPRETSIPTETEPVWEGEEDENGTDWN